MIKSLINRIFKGPEGKNNLNEYISKVFLLRNKISRVYKNRLRLSLKQINLLELEKDIDYVKKLGPVSMRKKFTKFEMIKIDSMFEKYSELEKMISNSN